ncbi:ABC transporter substrate-binding protein [Pseudokineococcus basanitobsidens]|uniref:ABC transporter substrate-binding protein n=1 Tax=Pseudokineococcus basanitobsidens TaxID=1926649 RepID=A0ABU8RK31_9ACTN
MTPTRALPRRRRAPRRPRLVRPLAAAALAPMVLVGACGGTDGDAAAGGAQTSGDAEAPSTGGAVVEHTYGSTTVPADPQRVVTIGFNEEDFALALGTTPVGTRQYLGDYDAPSRPWAQELLPAEPLPTVGAEELDLEAIAALDPDLILGIYSFVDEQTYDLLSEIAPTVAESADFPQGGTPWQEQTLMTGQALGAEEEAQALVEDVEGQIQEAAAALPAMDGAVVPVDLSFDDGTHNLLAPEDLRARLFTDLGAVMPEQTGPISPELLDTALDGDALVVLGASEQGFVQGPVVPDLPVVTEDRTVFLGGYDEDLPAAIGYGSPLSIPFVLDAVVPPLQAALDGDPGTEVQQPSAS